MPLPIRFNRLELAGSLGDLGTLLPLAMGMILINHLSPSGIFFAVGIYYIFSGLYFGVTTAVQPMKVIGAYAVASALSAQQIMAATLTMAVVLLALGASGAMNWISRATPKGVVRGVQLSTGVLLMTQGIKCMIGSSTLQTINRMAEPYLAWQQVGGVPIGVPIGMAGVALTLLLLNNRRLPAALAVIGFGLLLGIFFGVPSHWGRFSLDLQWPSFLPLALPDQVDFTFALFALVLPQAPMTVGNAVLASVDLANEYFGDAARRITGRSMCISMGLANLLAFAFGGMPMCHGAGGLAAHYRFGARSAGSNLIIGIFLVIMVLLLGDRLIDFFHLLPLAILGVLLFFAGGQLALTIVDLSGRNELLVPLTILGVTLATHLAYGFGAGLLLALVIRWRNIDV